MPIGGEAMGSAIGGFFGGPKLKQVRYSDQLRDVLEKQVTSLGELGPTAADAARRYSEAVAASTPEVDRIDRETIGTLGDLARQYTTFDPAGTYERIRSGNISSLADQFVKMAALGEEGDKARLAALGYGGRGPSSYESILRSDRISRNIAPVLNTIYSTLGSDVDRLNTNRLANLGYALPVLDYRRSIPGSRDARVLLPYQAEASMLGDQVALGTDLGDAFKSNIAGFKSEKNKWANFFEQSGRALDQAADRAIDLYTGYLGGGMGGLGGGGGGGGGGTKLPTGPSGMGYGSIPSTNMGFLGGYERLQN